MTIDRARALRSTMTDAERRLWHHLRRRQLAGWRFRRQHPCGPWIVDFVCLEAKLAIELDGGQHVEREDHDRRRTASLARRGLSVLRYWNDDALLRTQEVLAAIAAALPAEGPRPSTNRHRMPEA